jgi:hypothetical protein
MRDYDEYEWGHDFYVALAAALRHDGTPCATEPGAFVYVADGPRIIEAVDEYGNIGVGDYGGPITGGWIRNKRQAYRGGCDHVRARAAQQEARLRRRQREKGRKHG